MSRKDRKNRTDITFNKCTTLKEAIDNAIKQAWYINDAELDFFNENITDEEADLIIGSKTSFSDIKKAIVLVDRLLSEMYKNH